MSKKKPNYTCIRCEYETKYKTNMHKHLFYKNISCPQTRNLIELTDEIKQHILDNRIYIIPKALPKKYTKKTEKSDLKVSEKPDIKVSEKIDIKVSNKLVRVEGIRDLGVPSGVRSPNCVYCILIGLDTDLNKLVFKFGLCENFNTRMSTHRKTYPHSVVVFVVSLGEYAVRPVEDTIKYFEKVKTRIVNVATKDSVGREYFACLQEDMDSVMLGILDEIKNHHGEKVNNVYYKSPKEKITTEEMEIEKEKTKQAEAAVKKAELELEILKLKLQLSLNVI